MKFTRDHVMFLIENYPGILGSVEEDGILVIDTRKTEKIGRKITQFLGLLTEGRILGMHDEPIFLDFDMWHIYHREFKKTQLTPTDVRVCYQVCVRTRAFSPIDNDHLFTDILWLQGRKYGKTNRTSKNNKSR